MNRTPLAKIRRLLRREVGFGCPVEGCGSPYLTYHHFDPPWARRPHHEPKGMLALCLQHHKEADAGAFTDSQLRQLKKRKSKSLIRGHFSWRRKRLFIIAGSNFFLGSPSILTWGTRKLIWFGKDHRGHGTVNLDLFSPSGQLVLSMRDNDWVVLPSVEDIDSPPSARRLVVRSKAHAVSLDLEFRNRSLDQTCDRVRKVFVSIYSRVKNETPSIEGLLSIEGFKPPTDEDRIEEGVRRVREYIIMNKLNTKSICTCELKLKIQFPVPLELTATKIESRPGESMVTFSGCLMGSATVLKI